MSYTCILQVFRTLRLLQKNIKKMYENIYDEEKYYIGDYIKIILSPSRHSLFLQRVSARPNTNCLQYFSME